MSINNKLVKNTYCSLLYQIVLIISGFIIPRLLLRFYGSSVNGLLNSISQFMQLIAFLELGIGSVVETELYEPLVLHDIDRINSIISSAQSFYRVLGAMVFFYVLLLCVIYPSFVKDDFEIVYTVSLILIISISFFTQYYFGVVDRLLLFAAQRGYVIYNVQSITLSLGTIVCVMLMYNGVAVHIVKLASSLLYLIRPIILRIYVDKIFSVKRNVHNVIEPLKQKWNGVSQHIAAVILESTDVIILTFFSTLQDVSVYSVYHMVIYGIKTIVIALTAGVKALLGELWAKKDYKLLEKYFNRYELLMHTFVTIIFTCVGVLIIPFIKIYTCGISDASYEQPIFAYILVSANAMHCLRIPYSTMIMAVGHYKQTQNKYMLSTIINITISVILVKKLGLIGVAIGTLVAMVYQTLWMVAYTYKYFIKKKKLMVVKQFLVDIGIVVVAIMITKRIEIYSFSYISWILMAIKVFFVAIVVAGIVNFIFFRKILVSISN